MENEPNTKAYDVFKLIVALILLLILIFLCLQRPASSPAEPPQTDKTSETTETAVTEETEEVEDVETQEQDSGESEADTETGDAEPQQTEEDLPPFPDDSDGLVYNPERGTLDDAEVNPVYQLNSETREWEPVASAEDSVTADSASDEIPGCGSPSKLVSGGKGVVQSSLNMRSSPGIANNWLMTMSPGTELNILGSPTCLPHNEGVYLWWNIEIPDGQSGWSAEAPQNGDFYFIEPVE